MRVEKRIPREGIMVLVPETLDDLYHLTQLVRPGDQARASTWRTMERTEDVERRGKAEKKRMTLTLDVQDVEFHAFADRLRIHGTIAEGPQDLGAHHTLNIEADAQTPLRIRKIDGWRKHELDRVQEAVAASKRPTLYILAVEEDEATLAEVRAYGVREIASKRTGGLGKMYAKAERGSFMDEVLELVAASRDPEAPLIVVGPGWTRERVVDAIRQKLPEHGRGIMTEGTGQAGMVGVHEAIRRGMVARVVRDHAVALDVELFERMLTEVAKGSGLATYGPVETREALDMGAVETLLVTDALVRKGQADDLLRIAEATGTHVHIVSEQHETGEQLARFGGAAALLRYAPG